MLIDILTIFPEMFGNYLGESMLKRAQEKGAVTIKVHNLRDWATDKHRITDDRPFGGGPGMVMKAEPIFLAVEQLKRTWSKEYGAKNKKEWVILLSPQGRIFKQAVAEEFKGLDHLTFISGRYEGVDQRVIEHLVDEEISIGEYVLTGGELPAMVVVDAVTRLLPGVLGNPESLESESFNDESFDYPVYTQPREFRGMKVPEELFSGNHEMVAKLRKDQASKKNKSGV